MLVITMMISLKAVAVPATVPNVDMIEKPIGPQLQIPAEAPIIEPSKLPPIFVVLFCSVLICLLYTSDAADE